MIPTLPADRPPQATSGRAPPGLCSRDVLEGNLPPRKHGLHAPYEPQQLVPWVFLVMSYVCIFVFIVPERPNGWVGLTAAYVASTAVMLLFGLATTFFVSPYLSPKQEAEIAARSDATFCNQCSSKRAPGTKTHHCSRCNRCCHGFDHHCPWLNMCIAQRNMKFFYGLLVFSICIFLLHFGFVISFAQTDGIDHGQGRVAAIAVLSLGAFFGSILLISVLINLLYIRAYRGLTTYEYIEELGKRFGERQLAKDNEKFAARRLEIEAEQAKVREEWRVKREQEAREREAKASKHENVEKPSNLMSADINTSSSAKDATGTQTDDIEAQNSGPHEAISESTGQAIVIT